MSWFQSLYKTYDACADVVGVEPQEGRAVLLPLGYMYINTHIHVILDQEGKLREIETGKKRIGGPCTIESEARTSNAASHPHLLFDQLEYIATHSSFNPKKHENYINQLEKWCKSDFGHPKVRAIYSYVSNDTLIDDLVRRNILVINGNGELTKPKGTNIEESNIKKIGIRFSVIIPEDFEKRAWIDGGVVKAYHAFYVEKPPELSTGLCYVTGKSDKPISPNNRHPKGINMCAYNPKLISCNDNEDFTYRGRFSEDSQVLSVSYEASQKAHQTLRWLIEDRAFRCKEQAIVIWSSEEQSDVVKPLDNSMDIYNKFIDLGDLENDRLIKTDSLTDNDYAKAMRNALKGFNTTERLKQHKRTVCLLVTDAATDGRMAVTFYREFQENEYFKDLVDWHETSKWHQPYNDKEPKKGGAGYFIGTPSVDTIIETVYGRSRDDKSYIKIKKAARERLLHCMFDGERLSIDMVRAAINKTSNPMSFKNERSNFDSDWFDKQVGATCSLVRRYYYEKHREEYEVKLEESRRDRDYLYGRLLAIADKIESQAMYVHNKVNKGEEGDNTGTQRPTNAIRYMTSFSHRPFRGWEQLAILFNPYFQQLSPKTRNYYQNQIDEIMVLFEAKEYENDKPLDGRYLLGFSAQRYALRYSNNINERNEHESDEQD